MEPSASILKKFSIGTLIGIVSTMPGVSGAVLAVCFGIYERLIADIADFVHKIREDFGFLMTVGLGIAFGIVIVSLGLDFILENYEVASMMLFTGLILGQLPELWKHTEPEIKLSKLNVLSFIVGLIIMGFFLILGASEDVVLSHNLTSCLYMILIGVIFSVSHLAPGISGSTVLLAMGLLAPLTHTIATFDIFLMVPLLIGVFAGLFSFAKVIHYALKNYRKSTYMMIFGLTVGSIFVIMKEAVIAYSGVEDLALGAVAFVAGILVSIWFSRLGRNTSEEFASK
jgi:putative membrane protein